MSVSDMIQTNLAISKVKAIDPAGFSAAFASRVALNSFVPLDTNKQAFQHLANHTKKSYVSVSQSSRNYPIKSNVSARHQIFAESAE